VDGTTKGEHGGTRDSCGRGALRIGTRKLRVQTKEEETMFGNQAVKSRAQSKGKQMLWGPRGPPSWRKKRIPKTRKGAQRNQPQTFTGKEQLIVTGVLGRKKEKLQRKEKAENSKGRPPNSLEKNIHGKKREAG